jgi:hypothetical protein
MQQTEKAVRIIRDAGGEVVGRTRLQKFAYLLELTRLGDGFQFEYRHYGPYSEQLAIALLTAKQSRLIQEDERTTNWGGSYCVYRLVRSTSESTPSARRELIHVALSADPVSLELAATAAFLAVEGVANPWTETARRKPEKAVRLENAKELYAKLRAIRTPEPLPAVDN